MGGGIGTRPALLSYALNYLLSFKPQPHFRAPDAGEHWACDRVACGSTHTGMGSGTRQFPLAAEADDACAPQAYKLSFAPAHLAPAAAQASARPKQLLRTAGGHRRTGSGCAESGRLSCGKCGRSVPSSMLHMSREEVAHEVEVEKKFLLTGVCTHNVVHVETHAQYPHFASSPYSVRTTTLPPPTHTNTHSCVQVEQKTEWPSRLRI